MAVLRKKLFAVHTAGAAGKVNLVVPLKRKIDTYQELTIFLMVKKYKNNKKIRKTRIVRARIFVVKKCSVNLGKRVC